MALFIVRIREVREGELVVAAKSEEEARKWVETAEERHFYLKDANEIPARQVLAARRISHPREYAPYGESARDNTWGEEEEFTVAEAFYEIECPGEGADEEDWDRWGDEIVRRSDEFMAQMNEGLG